MEQVFVLIHGTFARAAKWVRDDSNLADRLRSEFPNSLITNVPWSGRNRFKARAQSAVDLQERVHKLRVECPHARITVIAHSHGGTLALHALSDASLSEQISAIICLSSPFLWVRPRWSRFQYVLLNQILTLTVCIPMAIVLFQSLHHAGISKSGMWATKLGIILVVALIWSQSMWLIEKRIRKLSDESTINPGLGSKTLILRTTADEAGFILSVASFLSWLTSYPFRVISRVLDRAFHKPFDRVPTVLSWFGGLVSLILGWFCLIFVGWLEVILFLPVAILNLAYGPELLFASLFAEVTAESTPPGKWEVRCFEPDELGITDTTLRHSELYQNDDVISEIFRWLHQRGI